MFRCVIEESASAPALEIPQWMFDAVVCCRMRMAETPIASAEALLELKRLLSSVPREGADFVLEAQYRSLSCEGGADAILGAPAAGDPTQAISLCHQDSRLGTTAARDPAADGAAARATAARAAQEGSSLRIGKGDGR